MTNYFMASNSISAYFDKEADAQKFIKEFPGTLPEGSKVTSTSIMKQNVHNNKGQQVYPAEFYWMVSVSFREGAETIQQHFEVTDATAVSAPGGTYYGPFAGSHTHSCSPKSYGY
jgi:hypothetical protein